MLPLQQPPLFWCSTRFGCSRRPLPTRVYLKASPSHRAASAAGAGNVEFGNRTAVDKDGCDHAPLVNAGHGIISEFPGSVCGLAPLPLEGHAPVMHDRLVDPEVTLNVYRLRRLQTSRLDVGSLSSDAGADIGGVAPTLEASKVKDTRQSASRIILMLVEPPTFSREDYILEIHVTGLSVSDVMVDKGDRKARMKLSARCCNRSSTRRLLRRFPNRFATSWNTCSLCSRTWQSQNRSPSTDFLLKPEAKIIENIMCFLVTFMENSGVSKPNRIYLDLSIFPCASRRSRDGGGPEIAQVSRFQSLTRSHTQTSRRRLRMNRTIVRRSVDDELSTWKKFSQFSGRSKSGNCTSFQTPEFDTQPLSDKLVATHH